MPSTTAWGNKKRVSEAYSGASATAWTTFDDYDPFGRAGTITQPDAQVITVNYTGVRAVARTVKVSLSGTATFTSATTSENYDAYGRLYQVTEPGAATATYTYDAGNRLTGVKLSGGGQGQVPRQFTYDGRGFLIAECHTELQPGDPCIRYTNIDARGHAGTVDAPPDGDNGENLTFTYDKAERVIDISASEGSLKKFFYHDNACGTGNLCKGKLDEAWRYNRRQIPWSPSTTAEVIVKEDYLYTGLGGRVSERKTAVDGLGEDFVQSWTYDDLGNVAEINYPTCFHTGCSGVAPVHTVVQEHTMGRLTKIVGYANALTYHANGMVATVRHAFGAFDKMIEHIDVHPTHGMRRPHTIWAELPNGTTPSLGVHRYDGAGNLYERSRGDATERYSYDFASRLKRYTLDAGAYQESVYDTYGNLTQLRRFDPDTGQITPQAFPTSESTNRLTGVQYDARGNLTSWPGEAYTYDPLNMLIHRNFPAETYLYSADEERIATLQYSGGTTFARETWTLRGLDNKVLRRWEHDPSPQGSLMFSDGFESGNTVAWDTTVGALLADPPSIPAEPFEPIEQFAGSNGIWTWVKDYVYRDGLLLASPQQGGDVVHFAVDHLGTPRIFTDHQGNPIGNQTLWGFGQVAGEEPFPENHRFTGHERDNDTNSDQTDDLDYMHARHYSTHFCRFLSTDPSRASARPSVPQSWNRYSYARNSPLTFFDPDGKKDRRTTSDIALLEDPDVLVAIAGIVRQTRLDLPLQDRQEAGAVVSDLGKGDFGIDGRVVTQQRLTSVTFELGINSQGQIVAKSGKPLAATIHSHPGTGKITLGGVRTTIVGGRASRQDRAQAKQIGKPVFIVNENKSLIKVTPKGTKTKSRPVLTGKDFKAFLNRARAAAFAKATLKFPF